MELDHIEECFKKITLVATVVEGWPEVTIEQAAVAITAELGFPRSEFSVHNFAPENIIIGFASKQLRDTTMERRELSHSFTLLLKPWNRLA
ncbi:hypothetical protein E2562_026541 [Oryza meyeriana var. granulata]|uniref:Uncharacterized protein n=1 Tax=Oryza meyeriana var. granulata TaxID=110450 RepID=A0A6G1CRY4_9ORYZ|nr:hypothetical protein E2562_026541 [Oryza meyeriana var. granulata]